MPAAALPQITTEVVARIVLDARSVTIVPTETSGIPASNVITQTSHSQGPQPTREFKSDKERKVPVGLIWGVAIAIVAAIMVLFLLRLLFVRKKRREAAAAAAASAAKNARADAKASLESGKSIPMVYPTPPKPPPAHGYAHEHNPGNPDADAVELKSYEYPPARAAAAPPTLPLPSTTTTAYTPNATGWSAGFSAPTSSGSGATPVPGPTSSPEERQAYLASEIRTTQALLETGGQSADERKALKAKVYELEQRQTSAWALGLE
ncbi:hypothetical protein MKEN_01286600 [Mycena kentingensis (nom. inval.)]|nr:hypothetical protein MKEN_01286600 [Mycena kentingensis (nom. inval.)]